MLADRSNMLADQSSPKIGKSAWISLFYILCILSFCFLLVVSVILLSTLPIYLTTRKAEAFTISNYVSTIDASYFVLSGDIGSQMNIDNIDVKRTEHSFAKGLSLPESDSLRIQDLSEDTVSTSNRRKRNIQCDPGVTNTDGTGLIFLFDLQYPTRLFCQTNDCKIKKFKYIYQRFNAVSEMAIELAGNIHQLKLCSLGPFSITEIKPNNTNSESTSTTAAFTSTTSEFTSTTPEFISTTSEFTSTTPEFNTTSSDSTSTSSEFSTTTSRYNSKSSKSVRTSSIFSTTAPTYSSSTSEYNNTDSGPPGTNNFWQFAVNMSSARYQPSTTLTTDQNFVIVSGSSSIYDFPSISISTIDILTETGNLISSQDIIYMRNFHTTNHLPSSNLILFAGGINAPDGSKLNNAELFDLINGTTRLINMSSIRFDHQSTVIQSSNKIVLIGGTNDDGTASDSGDVFDGEEFTSVFNQMVNGRRYHTMTYLPTINKILITGGETTIDCTPKILDTIELYNIDTNMFESLENITMSSPRSLHTATYLPLPYNQVLILGGSSDGTNALDTYEIFNVSSLSFINNGTLSSARAAHTATLLKNKIDILIVGGYSSNEAIDVSYQPIAPCELFNIKIMSTTISANMSIPRALHTAVLLPNTNDVLCCGGVDSYNTPLSSCERYIF